MLHYFGFTIQLVMSCFNVKVNNLVFDTSKKYHKCMVFYEDLDKQSYNVYMVYISSSSLYPVRFVTFSESNQTQ